MIDRYFTQHKTRNRLQNGPIGPFFPAFITALEDRGHAAPSIRRMIRTADRLGRWFPDHEVSLQEANQDHVDLYLARTRPPARPAQEEWPLASDGTLSENDYRAFEAAGDS